MADGADCYFANYIRQKTWLYQNERVFSCHVLAIYRLDYHPDCFLNALTFNGDFGLQAHFKSQFIQAAIKPFALQISQFFGQPQNQLAFIYV